MRALVIALLCAACIERPFEESGDVPAHVQVDRSTLRDVLAPPPGDATPVGALFGNAVELICYPPGETIYERQKAGASSE